MGSPNHQRAKPTFNAAARLVSQKLGNFRLLNLLGVGGQAAVYLARDEINNIDVALKVFPRSPDDPREARLLREARIAERLKHPHILAMLEIDRNEQWHWVAMEFCNGGSLHTELKQRGVMSAERVRLMLEQIGDALYFAHQQNLIHRDVKPANILLTVPTKTTPAIMKLADFGLAAMTDGSEWFDKAAGTPYYLAPEVWLGQPAIPLTDIYALGVSAYQLLTARHPFDAKTREELARLHVQGEIPPLREQRPDVPLSLQNIIFKCMAKEPGDRYSSGGELAKAAAAICLETTSAKLQVVKAGVREVKAKAFDSHGMRSKRNSVPTGSFPNGSGAEPWESKEQQELAEAALGKKAQKMEEWSSASLPASPAAFPSSPTPLGKADRLSGSVSRPLRRTAPKKFTQKHLLLLVMVGFVVACVLMVLIAILIAGK